MIKNKFLFIALFAITGYVLGHLAVVLAGGSLMWAGPVGLVAGAVVSSVAGSAVASAVGGGILGSLVGSVVGFGINTAFQAAFSEKPSAPSFSGAAGQAQKITTRSSALPKRYIYGTVRVGSNTIFMKNHPNNTELLAACYEFAGHEVDEISEVYFDNTEVWTVGGGTVSTYSSAGTNVHVRTGSTSQTSVSSSLETWLQTDWTSNHIGKGVAYAFVEHEYKDSLYPNGLPNVVATVKGAEIYNLDTSTTEYSENPAYILYHYLTINPYGPLIPASTIDNASFIAAADVCDESVALEAGGTELRYRCSAAFTVDANYRDVVEEILDTFHGRLVYSNGTWKAFAGQWYAPVETITDAEVIGGYKLSTTLSQRDRATSVAGRIYDEDNSNEQNSFPAVTSSALVTKYGEDIRITQDFNFVPSITQAQRLAKQILLRSQQAVSLAFSLPFTRYDLAVGDTITINSSLLGINTTFEIYTIDFNVATFTLDVMAKQSEESDYDWASSEEGTTTALTAVTEGDVDYVPTVSAPTITGV